MEVPDSTAINFFRTHVNGEATGSVYFARCPVCGDSEKNKHKKRMYLIKKERNWRVFCHNCAYSAYLLKFVKDFFPLQYDYVVNQCVTEFYSSNNKKESKQQKMANLLESLQEKVKKNEVRLTNIEKFINKNCLPMTDNNETVKEIRNSLKERMLTDSYIDTLFYCYQDHYKERLIIPFYDNNNKIYYFQARKTKEHQMPKYTNWEDEEAGPQQKPEYNGFNVDKSRTVYLFEGIFNSLFVNNSIATLGVTVSTSRIKDYVQRYPKRCWIMDNDAPGKKLTKKLLEMGENCVIFPTKYKKIKDSNLLAIELGKSDLTEIIEKWSYNSIVGMVELQRS
jgi:hypothetical protein